MNRTLSAWGVRRQESRSVRTRQVFEAVITSLKTISRAVDERYQVCSSAKISAASAERENFVMAMPLFRPASLPV